MKAGEPSRSSNSRAPSLSQGTKSVDGEAARRHHDGQLS